MKTYTALELVELLNDVPRVKMGFFPTPFHRLNNLSDEYGVDIFIKREDMSGPSSFGGNKVRKIEYIVGEAKEQGYDTLITVGGYQSNAALQLAQYCNLNQLKCIAVLGDTKNQADPEERRGNLLLNSMLGTEIHLVHRDEPKGNYNMNPLWAKVDRKVEALIQENESQGRKVMNVPVGCTASPGWVAYIEVFAEITSQAAAMGEDVDYIFHANGSAGSLPGMIFGKLLTGAKTKIISINNRRYGPGEVVGEQDIFDRVKYLYNKFDIEPPEDDVIWAEINIDQAYLGNGYGAPTAEGSEAIIEVAKKEGLFLDPVYTGKSFSGLLGYIKSGKIAKGSKVCYIHTGGTGGIFAGKQAFGPELIEHIYR